MKRALWSMMVAGLAGGLGLAACSPTDTAPNSGQASAGQPGLETSNMVGMANPASQYCVSLGGWVEIREAPDGQVGYCHMPDGKVVEEWALFRASQPETQAANGVITE